MKKIEKLIHINTDEKQHVSPDTVFEMCCKINEIIDFLNQLKGQQVELTNKQVTDFVKHTDQNRELNQIAKESEKQPERCDCDYCKAYRFSMEKEPEKQEEWREKIKQMVLTDCFKDQPDIQRYIDFIEQLLSEREKELLEWVISEEDIPQNVSSLWASLRWFEIYKEAHKRLSKLLKEEE